MGEKICRSDEISVARSIEPLVCISAPGLHGRKSCRSDEISMVWSYVDVLSDEISVARSIEPLVCGVRC